MDRVQKMVREFMRTMGQTVGTFPRIRDGELRAKLIDEEASEFCHAVEQGDLVAATDAIGDLLYVTYGAAISFGVDMDPVMNEIHKSNMAKTSGPVRDDGKRLKPPDWTPPDIEGCLSQQVVAGKTVIALLGHAGSGKTLVAKHLVEHYGATRVSFAGPLKQMAKELFGLSDEQLYGSEKETYEPRYGRSSRVIMQSLGSLGRRLLAPDVWIQAALRQIETGPYGVYVIDDCRYPNEAAAVAACGNGWQGRVVKIIRPGVRTQHNQHESETGVDEVSPADIHSLLMNDGSVDDLLSQVDELMGGK